MEGGLLVLFLGLGFSIAPSPPEIFLPTPLFTAFLFDVTGSA